MDFRLTAHCCYENPLGGAGRSRAAASLLAVLFALAACGGGGGGDAPTAPVSAPPATTPPAAPPTAANPPAPAPTAPPTIRAELVPYTGEALLAFEWLNEQRRRAGLTPLVQSAELDAASRDHANYKSVNGAQGHTQVQGLPGFTGILPQERVARYGYRAPVVEGAVSLSLPADGMFGLVGVPYHRLGLLDAAQRDFGQGKARAAGALEGSYVTLTNEVRDAAGTPIASIQGGVSLFPYDGATEVPLIQMPETPNPVPEVYSLTDPARAWGTTGPDGLRIPGYTVSVQVARPLWLAVSSFTLTRLDAAGNPVGQPVPARIADLQDPIFLEPFKIRNWAFLIPLQPLEAGATYEASFVGATTLNGAGPATAVTRTWRFTTRGGAGVAWPQPRLQTDAASGFLLAHYTTPSGNFGFLAQATPVNCGAGVQIEVLTLQSQTVALRTAGVPPLPGCQAQVTTWDRATSQRDIRLIPMS